MTENRPAYATIAYEQAGFSVTMFARDMYTGIHSSGYDKGILKRNALPDTPLIRCDLATLEQVCMAIRGPSSIMEIHRSGIPLSEYLDKYRSAGVPIMTVGEYLDR
jgi:hypothetical protein